MWHKEGGVCWEDVAFSNIGLDQGRLVLLLFLNCFLINWSGPKTILCCCKLMQLQIKVRFNNTAVTFWNILCYVFIVWNPLIWRPFPQCELLGLHHVGRVWEPRDLLPNGCEQRIRWHCSTQGLEVTDSHFNYFAKLRSIGFKIWCKTILAGTSTGGCTGLPLHTPQNIVKTKHKIFCFYSFCFWSNLYDVIHVFKI